MVGRYIWLVFFLLVSLIIIVEGKGLQNQSAKFPKPVEMTMAEFEKLRPKEGWFRITGCQLSIPDAFASGFKSKYSTTKEPTFTTAYVPVQSKGEPRSKGFALVMETRDESILSTFRELTRLEDASKKEKDAWLDKHASSIFPVQTIEGVVQPLRGSSAWSKDSETFASITTPDALHIGEGSSPQGGMGGFLSLMGYVVLGVSVLVLLASIRGSRAIAEDGSGIGHTTIRSSPADILYRCAGWGASVSESLAHTRINFIPMNFIGAAVVFAMMSACLGTMGISLADARIGRAVLYAAAASYLAFLFLIGCIPLFTRYIVFRKGSNVDLSMGPSRKQDEELYVSAWVTGDFNLDDRASKRFVFMPSIVRDIGDNQLAALANVDASNSFMGVKLIKREGIWDLSFDPQSSSKFEVGTQYYAGEALPAVRFDYVTGFRRQAPGAQMSVAQKIDAFNSGRGAVIAFEDMETRQQFIDATARVSRAPSAPPVY